MDSELYNKDCIETLANLESQSIDCIFADPPYGISADGGVNFRSNDKTVKSKHYPDSWDSKPPEKIYFDEMLRVAKKVFICGGNFFTDKLPVAGHWIVWDKIGPMVGNPLSGDCELIWTNIPGKNFIKKYTVIQHGFIAAERERFHPTQKPVILLEQIFQDYLLPNSKVYDPYFGSGSSGVACANLGFDYLGNEINPYYFNLAQKRIDKALSTPRLFTLSPLYSVIQSAL